MDLIRIGELARRSGVPIATLKFYLREGLIVPARKTGRTMAWYRPETVERIQTIRELQERQFLPLDVIRETLSRDAAAPDDLAAVEAIAKVLSRHTGTRSRTREQVLERGATAFELDWLARLGLAVPEADGHYRNDDLALLSTLGAARRAGLVSELLPFDILGDYVQAIRALVAVELRLFRAGVVGRANRRDVGRLTTAATTLSERLVVLLRRKMILPTLRTLIEEESRVITPPAPAPRRRVRLHGKGRTRRARRYRFVDPANRRACRHRRSRTRR